MLENVRKLRIVGKEILEDEDSFWGEGHHVDGKGSSFGSVRGDIKDLSDMAQMTNLEAVSYTHLDVYKRQTVELITDCEIVRISADVLRKLAMENIEIALVCNRMQSVASMREYEYRKMILTCNPVQRYEYFLETYPGLEKYDGA